MPPLDLSLPHRPVGSVPLQAFGQTIYSVDNSAVYQNRNRRYVIRPHLLTCLLTYLFIHSYILSIEEVQAYKRELEARKKRVLLIDKNRKVAGNYLLSLLYTSQVFAYLFTH